MPLPSVFETRLALAELSSFCWATSTRSSYCVADVEYESWADELRLCDGDATLIKPSELRSTDLPSPVPFSRLGEPPVKAKLELGATRDRDLRDAAVDSGLGGTLTTRPSARGGCGNELILTVFRNVFPAALTPKVAAAARGCDGVDMRAEAVVEKTVDEGARRPNLGVTGAASDSPGLDIDPILFRVFATGSAGSATLGGPLVGRAGFGIVLGVTSLGGGGGGRGEITKTNGARSYEAMTALGKSIDVGPREFFPELGGQRSCFVRRLVLLHQGT